MVRRLLPTPGQEELSDEQLVQLYGTPTDLVRLNMAATVDGSATGSDGRSGSINTDADHAVFGLLRSWADVIVVGSGTVKAEGYDAPRTEPRWQQLRTNRPAHPALAVLTADGAVPSSVDTAGGGAVFALASRAGQNFGDLVEQLRDRGFRRILCEGGPTIAHAAVKDGALDEVCLTWSPLLVGGDGPRILHGSGLRRTVLLESLLEQDGTLLGRWSLRR